VCPNDSSLFFFLTDAIKRFLLCFSLTLVGRLFIQYRASSLGGATWDSLFYSFSIENLHLHLAG
jgi:uncharacterized membrane protein YczE